MAYYHRYDAHYQSLYAQGIPLWSDGPDHCADNIQKVCGRLLQICPQPQGKTLLDIGCGEGHLALPLAGLGFCYTGIDCSSHAIAKARKRVPADYANISFALIDILKPAPHLLQQPFGLVLDQACLHMLVLDQDRAIYFEIIDKLVPKDGFFYLSNQALDEEAYEGPLESLSAYELHFKHDLSKPKRWQAWHGDRWIWVELPSFAGRPKSRQGYIREFNTAGFEVCETIASPGGNMADFILVKATS